jgi:hypothetical protein
MVIYSLAHAAPLVDRLAMVHRIRLVYHASRAAKHRLRLDDLLRGLKISAAPTTLMNPRVSYCAKCAYESSAAGMAK